MNIFAKVREFAATENSDVVVVCAKGQIQSKRRLDDDESYVSGRTRIEKSGLDKLNAGILSFAGSDFLPDGGEPEVRAWTIKRNEGTWCSQQDTYRLSEGLYSRRDHRL